MRDFARLSASYPNVAPRARLRHTTTLAGSTRPAAIGAGLRSVLLAVETRGRLALARDANIALAIGGRQAALAISAWTARRTAAIHVFLVSILQAVIACRGLAFATDAVAIQAILVRRAGETCMARRARAAAEHLDALLDGGAPLKMADHTFPLTNITRTVKAFDALSFVANTLFRRGT